MALIQPPLEVGARIVAGRRVALKKDQVCRLAIIPTAEKVVLRDFVERRERGEGRNVSTEATVLAIGIDDHGHGVPANEALDAGFNLPVAGIGRLLFEGNRVEIGRDGRRRHANSRLAQAVDKIINEVRRFV